MIVDFHTHVFPDSLAGSAIASLTASCDGQYRPVHDGTVAGLLANMDRWGINVSVVQPVVMKVSQTRKINEWARCICSERIVSFGGICPQSDDYKRDIDFVADLGLKGLKFHAEYQNFVLDDEHMLRVYDYALSKGLILLHHGGYDPAFPAPYRSSPERFARVVKAMRGGVIIAAHLGGHDQWDDVERYLCGENIYLDTSMGFGYYPAEQFLRIVEAHGADRLLFASDSPWSNAGDERAALAALPLFAPDKAAILGDNAKRLLGL